MVTGVLIEALRPESDDQYLLYDLMLECKSYLNLHGHKFRFSEHITDKFAIQFKEWQSIELKKEDVLSSKKFSFFLNIFQNNFVFFALIFPPLI